MTDNETIIETCSEKKEGPNVSNPKPQTLSSKQKIADTLLSLIPQVIIAVVATLIEIKVFDYLAGFCYRDKSKTT
jgi:hypothetical protein